VLTVRATPPSDDAIPVELPTIRRGARARAAGSHLSPGAADSTRRRSPALGWPPSSRPGAGSYRTAGDRAGTGPEVVELCGAADDRRATRAARGTATVWARDLANTRSAQKTPPGSAHRRRDLRGRCRGFRPRRAVLKDNRFGGVLRSAALGVPAAAHRGALRPGARRDVHPVSSQGITFDTAG